MVSIGFGFASTSDAGLMVYEGFDYDHNTGINGLSGGQGWNVAWGATTSNTVVATAATLTYQDSQGQDLIVEGLGAHLSRSSRSASRMLPQRYTEGTYWISFLMQPTYVLGENNRLFLTLEDSTLFTSSVGQTTRLQIGKTNATNDHHAIRASVGTSSVVQNYSSVPANNNNLHYFVVRYSIGDGTIHLFIDPDLSSEPELSSAAAVITGRSSSQMPFDRIRIEAPPVGTDTTQSRGYFDEIRVGTSWASVTPIPEPAALGAVGLSGMLLMRRVRRV
jgi:hypothetical protein